MCPLRLLVDVNAGLAIATALSAAGHDVLFPGDLARRIAAVDAAIDALVYDLYRLTDAEIGIVEPRP